MKMFRLAKVFLLGASITSFLTGCATFMNGTRQSVEIASNPSDASVWVDRAYVGKTPMIVEMTRSDNHYVTIQLDGYEPYEAVFSRRLSKWVFGNVIFGGFIGLAVDAVSGGLYLLTPEQMQGELVSSSSNMAYSKKSNESCIMVVLKPDPSWKKVGNLVAIN